ncbi:MAG: DUF427 domain-containing protein [Gammaproteobacteria bacterium]|nr:MAG: DUF427 domain-containing protein [Gammaproteobacteria bacterium]
MRAIWSGAVLAESDDTIMVEGNHYFPQHSISKEYFQGSDTHTTCPWKGTASYYNIVVNGKTNKDAAWYYPDCSDRAKHFQNYVAFWKTYRDVLIPRAQGAQERCGVDIID